MGSNTSSHQGSGVVEGRPRSQLAAEVRACADALAVLVATLDPREVPVSWAPEVLAAFAAAERAAVSGRLLIAARAAEAGEWERRRCPSPAEWMAEQLGTSPGRARADLATSARLEDLDASADAVRAGHLSAEQADAVTDAAAVNPGAERDLLDHARRESLRRTRAEAERRKAEATSEEARRQRDERVRRERRVRCSYRNGAGYLEAVGPVAAVKELEQTLNSLVDRRLRETRDPASRKPVTAYRFDALVEACTRGTDAADRRVPARRLVFVRVDLAALRRGSSAPGELCEIGGIPVSVAELRRTLGDSILQLVLTNGEAVVDLVHLGRKPTVAQMLAKLFTDASCVVAGCDRTVRLEFDHRHDWVRVMTTELANLDLPCDHHHRLKTNEGWQLVAGTGRRPMVPPSDPRHPARAGAAAPSPRLDELRARAERIAAAEQRHRARRAGQGDLFEDTG